MLELWGDSTTLCTTVPLNLQDFLILISKAAFISYLESPKEIVTIVHGLPFAIWGSWINKIVYVWIMWAILADHLRL